jgi:hypothetical protein
VFASVAALGAGLQVAAESVFGRVQVTDTTVALLVAVPVDIYLVSVGLLHAWPLRRPILAPIVVACLAILAAAFAAGWIGVPLSVLAIALIVAAMVAYNLVILDREATPDVLSGET